MVHLVFGAHRRSRKEEEANGMAEALKAGGVKVTSELTY